MKLISRQSATVAALFAASLTSSTTHAVAILSNDIYEVRVEESADGPFSVGSWTAFTGSSHPTGAGNDLLFQEGGGGTIQTTNFSSLRVYDPAGAVDYTFGGQGSGIDLDPFVTSEGSSPLVPNGHRTVWNVTDAQVQITQDVGITGTELSNSAIYHTIELTNTGDSSNSLGWRNLYDWQVDDPSTDDGPSNQIEFSDGTVVVGESETEFSHEPGDDQIVRVSKFPGDPTYEPLLALGFDPGFLPSLPTTIPDEYVFGDWQTAVGSAFDFSDTGTDVATLDSNPDGDSAGLSWFGRDLTRAITLEAAESVRLTQIIFGVVPGDPPPPLTPSGTNGTIPEPTSLALLSAGFGAFSIVRRRKSRL